MSLRVSVIASNINAWVRDAANGINSLIGRADALEGRAAAVEARADALEAFQASLGTLGNYVDDTAAAAGGVAVGGLYRNGSAVMVRVT